MENGNNLVGEIFDDANSYNDDHDGGEIIQIKKMSKTMENMVMIVIFFKNDQDYNIEDKDIDNKQNE